MNQTSAPTIPISSLLQSRPSATEPGIPRIIHQTFMSKKLPAELQENVDNLKRLNPGWAHRLYDDDDITAFILDQYGPEVLRYYERINPHYGAARADLFRYLLVYRYGGVYLDIKSTCTAPLDKFLQPDDQYVLAHWRNKPGESHDGFGKSDEVAHIDGGEYQQWHVVAAPGHPFLKAVLETVLHNIDQYRPWRQGTGGIGVLRLTGPLAYTLAIHPLLATAPHRIVSNEADLGLQYSVYKNGSHRTVYKKNYGRLTESIVYLDRTDKVWASLYSVAKRSKHLLFGQ
ncbi:glycosyltransferase family 32 protein [Hymenobacter sp. GOD-10R]|uniref:glycosyltransferase family 32 protein n=1 Tax=Hymenobacter sp. GOD-10R TaxID=3093922 RepID=UPI002D770EF6|nr:glycosyltransferase [Hymenobacter sp. GOD-10R]WRQ27669.1 glycosyltransferase [Hymenobacter sp. GOD-10R]